MPNCDRSQARAVVRPQMLEMLASDFLASEPPAAFDDLFQQLQSRTAYRRLRSRWGRATLSTIRYPAGPA